MNNTTYSYIVLPHVVFSHGDFVFFFKRFCVALAHEFKAELQVLEEKLRNTEECRVREPRNFENQVWWRGSEFIARFFVQNVCKIHHDETMRWWDRYDKGMIKVCFTNYLSENGRCQGVDNAWLLLTASDTRHPSRVNGKKRDVNCRRRFAICSYLKPGYGYYGFVGYVFVGSNCFRVCSRTTSKTFKTPINSIYFSSLSCITESLTRNFMTAFLFTKRARWLKIQHHPHGVFVLPEIQLAEVRATELEAELKRQRLSQASVNPWIMWIRCFFQISRVFLKFLVGFKRKDFMQVWCKYDGFWFMFPFWYFKYVVVSTWFCCAIFHGLEVHIIPTGYFSHLS